MFPMICLCSCSYHWFFHSNKQSEKKVRATSEESVFLVFLWLISRVPTGPQISLALVTFYCGIMGFKPIIFSPGPCVLKNLKPHESMSKQ